MPVRWEVTAAEYCQRLSENILHKKDLDSVTVEIQIETQELSAAVGQTNGLSAEMRLKYRQHNL